MVWPSKLNDEHEAGFIRAAPKATHQRYCMGIKASRSVDLLACLHAQADLLHAPDRLIRRRPDLADTMSSRPLFQLADHGPMLQEVFQISPNGT